MFRGARPPEEVRPKFPFGCRTASKKTLVVRFLVNSLFVVDLDSLLQGTLHRCKDQTISSPMWIGVRRVVVEGSRHNVVADFPADCPHWWSFTISYENSRIRFCITHEIQDGDPNFTVNGCSSIQPDVGLRIAAEKPLHLYRGRGDRPSQTAHLTMSKVSIERTLLERQN